MIKKESDIVMHKQPHKKPMMYVRDYSLEVFEIVS